MCRKYLPTLADMKEAESRRVLAVDPGYDRLGISVLEGSPSAPTLIWSTCVTPPTKVREERLAYIQQALHTAIQEYKPHFFALESLYFSTNKKTALGVAEARGTLLAEASRCGLPVIEIPPGSVKLAVTGNGRADKKAIMRMIPLLVSLPPKKRLDDEFDAIAVGIAGLALYNPQIHR